MRTTPEECRSIGRWIGDRLNLMEGPVRFLIPEGGVSALDKPGQPFHDPEADAVLFQTLTETVADERPAAVDTPAASYQRSAFAAALAQRCRPSTAVAPGARRRGASHDDAQDRTARPPTAP